jgi:hypothetical protein
MYDRATKKFLKFAQTKILYNITICKEALCKILPLSRK